MITEHLLKILQYFDHIRDTQYDVWFLKYRVQRAKFFVLLDSFLPFYPPNNPKTQNFDKKGNTVWRYYHFIQVQHKQQSYYVWIPRYWARQNFLSFWTIFCTFTSLTTQKIKNWEKQKKKPWRYYNFKHVYNEWQSYDVWFLIYWVRETKFLLF